MGWEAKIFFNQFEAKAKRELKGERLYEYRDLVGEIADRYRLKRWGPRVVGGIDAKWQETLERARSGFAARWAEFATIDHENIRKLSEEGASAPEVALALHYSLHASSERLDRIVARCFDKLVFGQPIAKIAGPVFVPSVSSSIEIVLEKIDPKHTGVELFLEDHLVSEHGATPIPFVGRSLELARLDKWLHGNTAPSRLLLLGPAGRGKSTLLARWLEKLCLENEVSRIQGNPLQIAFVPISIRYQTSSLNSIYVEIASQLSRISGMTFHGEVYQSNSELISICRNFLREISSLGKKTLIVLDGVDEVLDGRFDARLIPRELGKEVKVIVSARLLLGDRGSDGWMRRLAWEHGTTVQEYFLPELKKSDLDSEISFLGSQSPKEFSIAEELLSRAAGEPFLLRFYLEELWAKAKARRVSFEEVDLSTVETGYNGLFERWFAEYEDHWANSNLRVARESTLKIFAILACAKGPISVGDIVEIISEIGKPIEKRNVDQALTSMERLLVEAKGAEDRGRCDGRLVSFSHPVLASFLKHDYTAISAGLIVAVEKAFCKWGAKQLKSLECKELKPRDVSPYLVRYLASHFAERSLDKDEIQLLASPKWLHTCLQKQDRNKYLSDCDLAIRMLLEGNDVDEGAALAVAISSSIARSIASREMPPPGILPLAIDKRLISSHDFAAYSWWTHRPGPSLDLYASSLIRWLKSDFHDSKLQFLKDILDQGNPNFCGPLLEKLVTEDDAGHPLPLGIWEFLASTNLEPLEPGVRFGVLCEVYLRSPFSLDRLVECIPASGLKWRALESLTEFVKKVGEREVGTLYDTALKIRPEKARLDFQLAFIGREIRVSDDVLHYFADLEPNNWSKREIKLVQALQEKLELMPAVCSMLLDAANHLPSDLLVELASVLFSHAPEDTRKLIFDAVNGLEENFARLDQLTSLASRYPPACEAAKEVFFGIKSWSQDRIDSDGKPVGSITYPMPHYLKRIIDSFDEEDSNKIDEYLSVLEDDIYKRWGYVIVSEYFPHLQNKTLCELEYAEPKSALTLFKRVVSYLTEESAENALAFARRFEDCLLRANALVAVGVDQTELMECMAEFEAVKEIEFHEIELLSYIIPAIGSEGVDIVLRTIRNWPEHIRSASCRELSKSNSAFSVLAFDVMDVHNLDNHASRLEGTDASTAVSIANSYPDDTDKLKALSALAARSEIAGELALEVFEGLGKRPTDCGNSIWALVSILEVDARAELLNEIVSVVPDEELEILDELLCELVKIHPTEDTIAELLRRDGRLCSAALTWLKNLKLSFFVQGQPKTVLDIVTLISERHLGDVFSIARSLESVDDRAVLLCALATRQADAIGFAVEAAFEIEKDFHLWELLRVVLPNLSTEAISEFRAAAEDLKDPDRKNSIYELLAKYDKVAFKRALESWRSDDSFFAAERLAQCVVTLPAAMFDDVLEFANGLEDPESKAYALSALATRFPEVLPTAFASLASVEKDREVGGSGALEFMNGLIVRRLEAIHLLAPHLSGPELQRVAEIVGGFENPVLSGVGFALLTRHHRPFFDQCFEKIVALPEMTPDGCAWIVDIVSTTAEPVQLQRLIGVVQQISDPFSRCTALLALARAGLHVGTAGFVGITDVANSSKGSAAWFRYEFRVNRREPRKAAADFATGFAQHVSHQDAWKIVEFLCEKFEPYESNSAIISLLRAHPVLISKTLTTVPEVEQSLELVSALVPFCDSASGASLLAFLDDVGKRQSLEDTKTLWRARRRVNFYKRFLHRSMSPGFSEALAGELLKRVLRHIADLDVQLAVDLAIAGVYSSRAKSSSKEAGRIWSAVSDLSVNELSARV